MKMDTVRIRYYNITLNSYKEFEVPLAITVGELSRIILEKDPQARNAIVLEYDDSNDPDEPESITELPALGNNLDMESPLWRYSMVFKKDQRATFSAADPSSPEYEGTGYRTLGPMVDDYLARMAPPGRFGEQSRPEIDPRSTDSNVSRVGSSSRTPSRPQPQPSRPQPQPTFRTYPPMPTQPTFRTYPPMPPAPVANPSSGSRPDEGAAAAATAATAAIDAAAARSAERDREMWEDYHHPGLQPLDPATLPPGTLYFDEVAQTRPPKGARLVRADTNSTGGSRTHSYEFYIVTSSTKDKIMAGQVSDGSVNNVYNPDWTKPVRRERYRIEFRDGRWMMQITQNRWEPIHAFNPAQQYKKVKWYDPHI